jgi:hypothetical protein
MAIRTISALLLDLSTGGSSGDKIETKLIRDIIDTLESLKADASDLTGLITITDVETLLSGGTANIVLPEADPEVVGALWNNAGTITISAG